MKKPKKATNVIAVDFGSSKPANAGFDPDALRHANAEAQALADEVAKNIEPQWRTIWASSQTHVETFKVARATLYKGLVSVYRQLCEMLAAERAKYTGDPKLWFEAVALAVDKTPYEIDIMVRCVGQAEKLPTYWADAEQDAINNDKLPDFSRFYKRLTAGDAPPKAKPPQAKPPQAKPDPDDERDRDDEGDDPGIALDTLATLATTLGLQPDVDVNVVIAHAEHLSQHVQRQHEHVKNLSVPSAAQTLLFELLRGSPGNELPDIHEAVADVETILGEHAKLIVAAQALTDEIETLRSSGAAVSEAQPDSTEVKRLKKQLDKKQSELDLVLVRDGGIAGIYRELGVKTTTDALIAIRKLRNANAANK